MNKAEVQEEINMTVLEQKIIDVLGKYHDAEPHKYLEAAEIIPLITQYGDNRELDGRIDERKMAMLHSDSWTQEQLDLLVRLGLHYPGDLERLAELKKQRGEL